VLVEALDRRRTRSVVVDVAPDRVNEVDLGGHSSDVYALCADARLPESLLAAGLRNRDCRGLVALTNDEAANLAAAVTVKLLRAELPVLARCESQSVAANMASFGTDHIVNPFEVFARELALAIHAPSQYLLRDWLTAVPGSPLAEPLEPPRGLWIVCGYGRFGRAVAEALEREGNRIRIIEPDPRGTGAAEVVRGSGTEAPTLEAAGIGGAVGIVAGTPDDVNNFSIVMTARELKPSLFVVCARTAGTTTCCSRRSSRSSYELLSRIAGLANRTPEVWTVAITPAGAPAAWREAAVEALRLEHLLTDHADRAARLDAIALLVERGGRDTLLPEEAMRRASRAGTRSSSAGPARRARASSSPRRTATRCIT
jgi:Trk K+ transport system NAD-binding subunit